MAENRFARTAQQVAARQDARAAALAEAVQSFVLPRGDERALDAGCGAGALALALAPLVREVVGVDRVPELLELARERAPGNAEFVEGDATSLEFDDASFDLAGTLRTLHHVRRPELVIAELTRVTRPGGTVVVIDQLAPLDPLEAYPIDRFERARDPSHTRLLPETDLRGLFEANGLVLVRSRRQRRAAGAGRLPRSRRLRRRAPRGSPRARAQGAEAYTASLGWYLLERRLG